MSCMSSCRMYTMQIKKVHLCQEYCKIVKTAKSQGGKSYGILAKHDKNPSLFRAESLKVTVSDFLWSFVF